MKKEGETHVNLREVRNLKEVIFFPYYTNPYIGTLRHIAHGQISSRATCDLT